MRPYVEEFERFVRTLESTVYAARRDADQKAAAVTGDW
jgi:hypothetical protein